MSHESRYALRTMTSSPDMFEALEALDVLALDNLADEILGEDDDPTVEWVDESVDVTNRVVRAVSWL